MKNKNFTDAYKRLPRAGKRRSVIRDEIILKTGVTSTIFYNWLSGITPVDEYSKPIIAEILGIPVYQLFPNHSNEQIINH